MENWMYKVSVIVPVYNVEKYIRKCIASIQTQTLKNIEIICVDDGSTDRSGMILDEYASKDVRVHVIHQENAGYGAAMNAGMAIAKGEFIGIVEGDDYIADNMYENLYRAAHDNQLDMIKSDAYYWMEKVSYLKRKYVESVKPYYNKVLRGVDRNIFFDFFMNIWTGIYRRDFLRDKNIKFHETPGASYQDNGFWMQTCLYAERAMWIDQAFYYYRQDNPEASVRSGRKRMAMIKEYEYIENLLKERGEEAFLPYCYIYRLIRMKGTFYRLSDEYKRGFCDQIASDYQKYMAYVKGNNEIDRWLRKVVKNPDEICDRMISKKKEIKKRINSCKNIIIYGAGKRGDIVFRGLYNEGYYHKIACFAVSKNSVGNKIASRDVILIKDAIVKYPDALIIVAVVRGTKTYYDMVQNLQDFGIMEYMDGTDIEENYYII